MAKELGIELMEDDLEQESAELSDDELDAVASGKSCYCAIAAELRPGKIVPVLVSLAELD